MANDFDKEMLKDALKEGAKEWLDEKMQALGWWTFRGMSAAALFALFYFVLISQGWKK